MTSTQKRYLEWPLFITVIWLWTSFEISIFQLPFGVGAVQIIPLLCAFVAIYFPINKALKKICFRTRGAFRIFSIMKF